MSSMLGTFSDIKAQGNLDRIREENLALRKKADLRAETTAGQATESHNQATARHDAVMRDDKELQAGKSLMGFALKNFQETGEAGTPPPGTDPRLWTLMRSRAAKEFNNLEINQAAIADRVTKENKAAFEEFSTYQNAINKSLEEGDVYNVRHLTTKASEILNIPFKAEWDNEKEVFNTYYRHSGSGDWEKTGTIDYEELSQELATMTEEKFTTLSLASKKIMDDYNTNAWGPINEIGPDGKSTGGRQQVYMLDGKEYLVTPQRNKANSNEVHFVVTDENNVEQIFESKRALQQAGYRYRDIEKEIAIAKKEAYVQDKARLLALTKNAEKSGFEVSDRYLTLGEKSINDATQEAIFGFKNGVLSDAVTVMPTKGVPGEDSISGTTVFVKANSVDDLKASIGKERRATSLGSMKQDGVEGFQFFITAKPEYIVKRGRSFTQVGADVAPSSAEVIGGMVDSNFKSKNQQAKEDIDAEEKKNALEALKPDEFAAYNKYIAKKMEADKTLDKLSKTPPKPPPNYVPLAFDKPKKKSLALDDNKLKDKTLDKVKAKLSPKEKSKATVESLTVELTRLKDKERIKARKDLKAKKNKSEYEELMLQALDQFFKSDYKG